MKKRRLLFPLLALLLGAGLLEAGLWAAGAVLRVAYHSGKGPAGAQTKILCVGDSFTFGVGAPWGQAYPNYLETMLREQAPAGLQDEIRVYNAGIPGMSSWELREKLDNLLDRIHPQIVLVLIGSNNSRKTRERNNWSAWKILKISRVLKAGFEEASVLLRKRSESAKLQRTDPSNPMLPDLERLEEWTRRNPDWIEAQVELGWVFCSLGKLQESARVYDAVLLDNPENLFALIGRGRVAVAQGDLPLARSFQKKIKRVVGEEFPLSEDLAYLSAQVGDRDYAEQIFRACLAASPGSETLASGLATVMRDPERVPDPQEAGRFDFEEIRLFKKDINAIVDAAQMRGAEVLLLSYPRGNEPVNMALEGLAKEQGLVFVDVTQVIPKDMREAEELLGVDGEHLNGLGYEVMAREIARVILDCYANTWR
ncbi:MAG: hypothetical protein JW937_05870 [Candidatus Omnitrophica bacterium]|nr:hypothetical protein [Candidatus Omnitrophota bacterium]